MVVTVKALEKNLKELESMLDNLPDHINRLKQQIHLCQEELQDIQHRIELSNFNAHEGWRLARDMQLTLQARRIAKDELKGLQDIYLRLGRHSPFNVHVQASSRDIVKHEKRLSNRRYRLRVRKDFIGSFDSATLEGGESSVCQDS